MRVPVNRGVRSVAVDQAASVGNAALGETRIRPDFKNADAVSEIRSTCGVCVGAVFASTLTLGFAIWLHMTPWRRKLWKRRRLGETQNRQRGMRTQEPHVLMLVRGMARHLEATRS